MTSVIVPVSAVLRRIGYEPDPAAPDVGLPAPPDRPYPAPQPPIPPGARESATHVLRLACEVLDGRRPAAQLAAHVDDAVLRYWRSAADRRRVRTPARFRRMRVSHPHHAAAEVAVTVELDGQVRALAARFDLCDDRWRCTAIRLG